MTRPSTERTNDEWVAALTGVATADHRRAVEDLARYLRGALVRVLRSRGSVDEDDLSDFTQETLLRITERIHTFRGDSRFTTWATAIATRVAFTEMRRRSVRRKGQAVLDRLFDEAQRSGACETLPADENLARRQLLQALEHAIATRLTERQRIAITAELRGIPTIAIAERLDTNQNALYKLVHDARKKLRAALTRAGFDRETMLATLDGGPRR